MKFIFILFFIVFSNSIFANEEDNSSVEIINLYESKSLDQMVLDNLNNEDEKEIKEVAQSSDEVDEVETDEVEVKPIENIINNFINKNEIKI